MWDNSNIPEKLLLRIYPGELDKGKLKPDVYQTDY